MNQPAPTLTGETVTITYTADPKAGHGQFLLANPGSTAVSASVDSVWFEAGTQKQALSGISIFDPDHNQTLDAHDLRVPAGATLRFWVGFPPIAHEPAFGESTAVGLVLRIGGEVLEARSPLQYVRRWPRGTP